MNDPMGPGPDDRARRFRRAYAEQRAAEGRAAEQAELLALPYVTAGAFARQWQVRARSFDAFLTHVLEPQALRSARLRIADLGAGNGWLCYRAAQLGHEALAIDVRTDAVDGLGAAAAYAPHLPALFPRIAASFEALPLASHVCDIAVFNAALHYALDLRLALAEAARIVRPGGRMVILDSPFYGSEDQGAAMVAQKHGQAFEEFGERATDLLALPFVEFLTRERLADASKPLNLHWRRQRVSYPFRYEVRPLLARVRGERVPSRFDLWETAVP